MVVVYTRDQTEEIIREIHAKVTESERVDMLMHKRAREYDKKERRALYMRNRKQQRV